VHIFFSLVFYAGDAMGVLSFKVSKEISLPFSPPSLNPWQSFFPRTRLLFSGRNKSLFLLGIPFFHSGIGTVPSSQPRNNRNSRHGGQKGSALFLLPPSFSPQSFTHPPFPVQGRATFSLPGEDSYVSSPLTSTPLPRMCFPSPFRDKQKMSSRQRRSGKLSFLPLIVVEVQDLTPPLKRKRPFSGRRKL